MPRTLSSLAVLVLTVAVLGLYLAHALFAHGPVAIAVQVLAALLMLWARLTFGAAASTPGPIRPRAGS